MLRPGTVPDDREVCSGVPTTGWRGEGGSNPVVDPSKLSDADTSAPRGTGPTGGAPPLRARVPRGPTAI